MPARSELPQPEERQDLRRKQEVVWLPSPQQKPQGHEQQPPQEPPPVPALVAQWGASRSAPQQSLERRPRARPAQPVFRAQVWRRVRD
ncbi:MAG: hypothetical protein L0099_16190, partial [Acidobacteria bacterium]|nr:hypothetical protein [Acidobacteriota bacterium]